MSKMSDEERLNKPFFGFPAWDERRCSECGARWLVKERNGSKCEPCYQAWLEKFKTTERPCNHCGALYLPGPKGDMVCRPCDDKWLAEMEKRDSTYEARKH